MLTLHVVDLQPLFCCLLRQEGPNPPLAVHQMSGSSYKVGILCFSTMGMFYFPVEKHTLRAQVCVGLRKH